MRANGTHNALETQRGDEGIQILADIDSQQPKSTSQAPISTKLAHHCSISSEDTNPYLAGEFVEALRPQFFYRKKDATHIQSYYVGQDFSSSKTPLEKWTPALVQGQKGFKLEASFDHVPTGYYNIVWTIRRQDQCRIKGAFQIRAIVEYEKEPWHKARYEFKHKKRSIKKALKQNGWQSLVSAERIQVHPHVGGANITVVLNRSSKVQGFGIQFQKIELRPVAMTTPGRFSKENFTDPDFRVHASDDKDFEAISRLEYSREAHYLAALSVLKHAIRVQVWDIRDVQNSPNENIAYRGAAFNVRHKHARHLAIGMSISPSGDQIAVFQEPRIGQWEADSSITDAEFSFRVFRNPLVSSSPSASPDGFVLNMEEGSATKTDPKRVLDLEEIPIKYSFLQNMIGYGQFVSFAGQEEEEDGSLATPHRRMPAGIHGRVAAYLRRFKKDHDMKPSLFVSCNGYHLDVFDSGSPKWIHLQTIELNHLSPLYSRRFTCESMMELIAGDKFLWFENGNRCCSVWDIMTGTNVSHIETTPVKLNDVRGNNTLSVSPRYEYLAIAGADGSISTYMIDSGVRLDKRKFPGATIEYIGFHGNQSSDLFVFVRDTITRELKWLILDPFQLRSERPTRAIPVPTKDGAIMASFKEEGSDDRNLVCVPNGPDIEFFWTSKPKASTLKLKQKQLSSPVMEPKQEQPASSALVPKQEQPTSSALVSKHEQLLSSTLEPKQEQPLSSTLEPKQEQSMSSELEPRQEQPASTLVADESMKISVDLEKDIKIFYEIKLVIFTIKNATGSSEPRPAQGIEIYQSREGDDAGPPERVFAMVPEPWVWLDLEEDAIKQPKPLSAFFIPHSRQFVILGNFTVQIWNLPSKTEARCTLRFYWSQPLARPLNGVKKVQSFYRLIRSCQFHQDVNGEQWISANLGSKRYPQYKRFFVFSLRVDEKSLLLQYCIQSIYFLAATHLFASTGSDPDNLKAFSKDIIHFNDQARSIRRFVQDHINKTIPEVGLDIYHTDRPQVSAVLGPDTSRPASTEPSSNLQRASQDTSENPKKTSVLLQLVDSDRFLVSNASFIVAILGSGDCNWIPPRDIKLNPVLKAARSGNTSLTQSLIDYCVMMTRKRHPYFMLPVIQSVEVLAEHFPDMLKDTFVKVSYVPALPYALSTSRIYMFRRRWNVHLGPIETALEFLGILHPKANNDIVSRPVYQMQPHLDAKRIPDGAPRTRVFPHDGIGNNGDSNGVHNHESERISSRRPAADESSRSKRAMITTMYDRQVFVAPFPCFSTYADPNSSDKRATYFSRLAGRNFFDSPAMKATLVFKWYRYGFIFWMMRFMYLFTFYTIFTVITAHVITDSAGPVTEVDIDKRYLTRPWKHLLLANAIMGVPLLLLEVWQMVKEGWSSYSSSLFNVVDCLSVSLVIASNILKLINSNKDPSDDGGLGPRPVWVVGFSILIMYLHLLFELRVIRSLGIFVNIIISITKKIFIFFILFTILIIGFSHALMYSTHTRQVACVPGSEGCDLTAGATHYPSGFFAAVAATYFFIAGRWDPLNDELDTPKDVAFHVIMIIFLFFSVILLMNVLIAIMNMAYEECREEGELAWLKQWSQVLDEFAHIFLSPWQKQTYLPDYIYYEATVKEVMTFSEENGFSNPENNSISSGTSSKMEGGKYTFVALDREELSSTISGYWSLPGTLKKPPSPPPSQRQAPPEASSTVVPPSLMTPNPDSSGIAEGSAAQSIPVAEPVVKDATKATDSFAAMYEMYCERFEQLQSQFDHILEEEFETLEAAEDCTSDTHDQQQHMEARERLQGELKLMQTSVQALSEDVKATLMENQIPLEGDGMAESTSLPVPVTTAEPLSLVPSSSPLSGTTTLLPILTASGGEGGQDYLDSVAVAGPTAQLTLDMIRLRDLYYSSLELEKSIQHELNPE